MKENVVQKVIEWGSKVGILGDGTKMGSGTFEGQYEKVVEELDEVGEAFEKLAASLVGESRVPSHQRLSELKMELGDLSVTVILLHAVLGISIEETLEMAYEKISSRKGSMVDGKFVKEA